MSGRARFFYTSFFVLFFFIAMGVRSSETATLILTNAEKGAFASRREYGFSVPEDKGLYIF